MVVRTGGSNGKNGENKNGKNLAVIPPDERAKEAYNAAAFEFKREVPA